MRLLPFAFLVFAACNGDSRPVDAIAKECGADGYGNLIGQSVDFLADKTFPNPVRIIKPGMAVTMDYSPSRLNVDLDKNNRIIRLWCG